MNIDAVKAAVQQFTHDHQAAFSLIGSRESQLLELAAIVGIELHYRSNGYSTTIHSPEGAGTFVVKTSTRGHPPKYSHISLGKNGEYSEAHMRLMFVELASSNASRWRPSFLKSDQGQRALAGFDGLQKPTEKQHRRHQSSTVYLLQRFKRRIRILMHIVIENRPDSGLSDAS